MSAQQNKDPKRENISTTDKAPPLVQQQFLHPQYLVPRTGSDLPQSFPASSNSWLPQGQSPSPLPWGTPWMPIQTQPPANPNWAYTINPRTNVPHPPDSTPSANYLVDSMRRIYNNDDGSIEIERVKVQKRASGDPQSTAQSGDMDSNMKSLVPLGLSQLNERRPPPRKNKIRKKMTELAMNANSTSSQVPIAQPWYPYMPYMPMYPPFPHPYCYGYPVWPGGSSPPTENWQVNSETVTDQSSTKESLPITNSSQITDSEKSDLQTSEFRNSTSLTDGSHDIDLRTIDVAPSDSISLGDYNRASSPDRDFISPTPSHSTHTHISEEFPSGDICKTQEWMLDMQKSVICSTENKTDNVSTLSKSSTPIDIPKAPTRRNRNKNKLNSSFTESLNETTSESTTNLRAAFQDLQKSVQDFETQINLPSQRNGVNISQSPKSERLKDVTVEQTKTSNNLNNNLINSSKTLDTNKQCDYYNVIAYQQNKDTTIDKINNINKMKDDSRTVSLDTEIPDQVLRVLGSSKDYEKESAGKYPQSDDQDGRESRASSCSYHSTRPSTDEQLMMIDTDSTDVQSPTGDEVVDNTDPASPTTVLIEETNEDYSWIMQQPGDAPELCPTQSQLSEEEDRRNTWRAEVSLWRAKLVVSLCRGGGLDRQDWSTFQLLVLHPLSLDLKLSLLHAPRLCGSNSSIGAGLVRSGLLHLTRYGEILLQPEKSRPSGWKSIKVSASQPWAPMKGSVEILRTLGYKPREDGVLRYPRRPTTETSILARLTLDMLVLAEELRLYLTGAHQYSSNISKLFFPSTSSIAGSPEPNLIFQSSSSVAASSEFASSYQPLNRPSSSASYGFVSAQSSTSMEVRSDEKETLIVDDSNAPELPKKKYIKHNENKTFPIKVKRKGIKRRPAPNPPNQTSSETEINQPKSDFFIEAPSPALVTTISVTPDITDSSLPDLSTLSSSSSSRQSDFATSAPSSSSESVTPVASPEPAVDNEGTQNDKTEAPKENIKVDKGSNEKHPDDHIYEEISEIRAQVAALRAKESATAGSVQAPPPLPPKAKLQIPGEDDPSSSITYPNVEWSTDSGTSSICGGSTGARRKKRRAPLPPSFMSLDWPNGGKASSDSNLHTNSTPAVTTASHRELSGRKYYDYNIEKMHKLADQKNNILSKDLNPFYDEGEETKTSEKLSLDSKNNKENLQTTKNNNPFDEELAPSGFIGKNPFYEDVEILKKENISITLNSSTPENVDDKDKSILDIKLKPVTPEVSESPSSDIERLKKRELRSPPPEPPRSATPNESEKHKASTAELKLTQNITKIQINNDSKNGIREQLHCSRVVASNNDDESTQNKLALEEELINQLNNSESNLDLNSSILKEDKNIQNSNTDLRGTVSDDTNIEEDRIEITSVKSLHNEESNLLRSILTNVMNSTAYIPEDDNKEFDINNDIDDFDSFQENETPQTVTLAFNLNENIQPVHLKDDSLASEKETKNYYAKDEEKEQTYHSEEDEKQKVDLKSNLEKFINSKKEQLSNESEENNNAKRQTVVENKDQSDVIMHTSENKQNDNESGDRSLNNINCSEIKQSDNEGHDKSVNNTNCSEIKQPDNESYDKSVNDTNCSEIKQTDDESDTTSVNITNESDIKEAMDDDKSVDIPNRSEIKKSVDDDNSVNITNSLEIEQTEPINQSGEIQNNSANHLQLLINPQIASESQSTTKLPSPVSIPQMPETINPLSLFDDIPYIDISESKNSRSNTPKKVEDTPIDQYEIPEIPSLTSLILVNPVSDEKLRETKILLRGPTQMPIITNSDLPPDNTPPPPPNTSPPNTPHTSPPETPHNSPTSSLEFINFPAITVEPADNINLNDATETAKQQQESSDTQETTKEQSTDPNLPNAVLLNKDMEESLTDDRYEIPEPPPDEVFLNSSAALKEEANNESLEDGYEIPEVARNQYAKSPSTTNKGVNSRSWCVSSFTEPKETLMGIRKSLAEACPLRPPRGRRNLGPPPRPPKVHKTDSELNPPPLPPKGLMAKFRRKSAATTSSSTPTTIQSRSVASTPTFGSKSPTTSSTPTSTRSKSKTLNMRRRRRSKRTRSWPFMLCDCMYIDYEDVQ